MADSKLSALTELAVAPADTDEFYVNDGGVSKRIQYTTFKADIGWTNMSDAVWAGGTQSEVADGASAVAFDFDTDNAYSTSGAKLLSLKNNGVEQAYVDKDGHMYVGGRIYPEKTAAVYLDVVSGNALLLSGTDGTDWTIGDTAEASTTHSLHDLGLTFSKNTVSDVTIKIAAEHNDGATNAITLLAQTAYADAVTNLTGADVNVTAGSGSANSAGAAHGGDVVLAGGTGYGTGSDGVIDIQSVLEVNASSTVANLPSGVVGQVARVTDANSPSVGSTVSGGGAAAALVWYNGSNWTVIGV